MPPTSDELLGRPIVLVVALALISLLPFAFMALTAFAKISTVLQIVRSAIGAQSFPSNTVMLALAAALTLLAMAPFEQRLQSGLSPVVEQAKTADALTTALAAVNAIREPLHDFLSKNASDKEKHRFVEVARQVRPEATRAEVQEGNFSVLVPAFVVTELGKAFAIGFLIYLPFLIIDLVVANVLLAFGMQAMSPMQVSIPFKLMLFVAIDGWGLLSQALVAGYR